jgi:phospholipase/carboxylesterase
MNNHLPTDLVHELRPARGEPAGALVLAHGRGADERDLLPFLDLLDPHGRLVGITPGGPFSFPPGGRHWYAVPRVGYPDPATFQEGYSMLGALVDAIPDVFGVPASRTILGGFSQGTVMSYALGLGAGRPVPAGIIALSGFIPTVEGWEPDLESRRGLPVWISHGRRDPVISVEFGRAARDLLTAGGLDVTYGETEAAHHVDPRAIATLPAWIEAAIERGGASA